MYDTQNGGIMQITLKFIPPTINKYIGRTNIFQYQKDKKQCHELVRLSTIGVNPKYESCKIKITYYFKDKRRHDPSNYDKFLLDGLVEANIIVDDNYNVIKEFTTVGLVDKENPRTVIEIEEL